MHLLLHKAFLRCQHLCLSILLAPLASTTTFTVQHATDKKPAWKCLLQQGCTREVHGVNRKPCTGLLLMRPCCCHSQHTDCSWQTCHEMQLHTTIQYSGQHHSPTALCLTCSMGLTACRHQSVRHSMLTGLSSPLPSAQTGDGSRSPLIESYHLAGLPQCTGEAPSLWLSSPV